MTLPIPLVRYQVDDLVPANVRQGPSLRRHHHVVVSVAEAGDGYDRVRVVCRTQEDGCPTSWAFLHHWGRWL